ncbi:MAG: cobalamin biosynthesis protein, partial [Pseudomonadota bacterium]
MAHIATLFASGTPIIGICAAGILIRAVAPLLSDKLTEPPILAVAEDGSAVVPLLGGHHGANDLALRIAEALETAPAITTASDLTLNVALDAPPPGWRIRNPKALGAVTAALIAGEPMHLAGRCAYLEPLKMMPNITFDPEAANALGRTGATLFAIDPDGQPAPDRQIGYEPTDIALGVGCARNCPSEELSQLVHATLRSAGLPTEGIAGIFSLDLKADEAAMLDLASDMNVPFRVFGSDRLEQETPRLANPSDIVFAEVGCHGVAEAAALAAAGPEADLIVEKQKYANATCAVALSPKPIMELEGRKRGPPVMADQQPPQRVMGKARADIRPALPLADIDRGACGQPAFRRGAACGQRRFDPVDPRPGRQRLNPAPGAPPGRVQPGQN